MSDALLMRLRSLDIVYRKQFTLKSGEVSDTYADVKKAYGDPVTLGMLCDAIYKRLDSKTTCVAASGHGGIPLASALAVRRGFKLALVRDQLKDHGNITQIDGHVPNPEDIVSVIDDVLTSGTSLKNTLTALEPTKSHIIGCYVVLKRGEPQVNLGVPVSYIYTLNDLTNKE